ncbi:MAG: hypothetical protein EOP34_07100 [Rickettsiales bacterium]|nr:MAG: hypothetical protein EOP34_07100 [Rickettsiales bacterium]
MSRLGENNIYYKNNCPAFMSDGRFLTYYNSTNELTESIQKMNHIKNINRFRNFMQNNGNKFINLEREFLIKNNTCQPRISCSSGYTHLYNNFNKF